MVKMRLAVRDDLKLVFDFFKNLTLFHLEGFKGVMKLRPYSEERTAKKLDTFLNNGDQAGILIAEENNEVLGVLGFYIESYGELANFDYDQYMEIDRIIVKDGMRGAGIGEKLIEEAEKLALSKGVHRMQLELAIFNEKAEKFYERLGYKCYIRTFAKDI
ncbi:GNAT family N-acetyltransferase [Sinanaerobacter chloroacetimidivorans]|uniref:GNAT family N-acetyltransferase n=1 Tax=Sinanaerobacter chloroacetimidivorans TaxID=2818044 RepID=A0A8J7VZI4_9FIRM|nr:GNAT family N-acetyltransferase [Sinanaerobacter chloroacetimidivorans]MBR0598017.1 GNAT family N-acetyltransferase [Sinanaerobacter chloroacetimidivorans]